MSCKVYTVQSVYTGQGPGTVHMYTQLWAEHRQGKSKNIGMSVDLKSFAVMVYLSEQNISSPKLSRPKHIPACRSVFSVQLGPSFKSESKD